MKIYIAGHKGLVGSAIARKIQRDGSHTWIGKTREELDLFSYNEVLQFLVKEEPDAIIIAAAKVGGILANSKYPVEFLNENLRIELNLMEAAHAAGIKRLLFLGSSCIYPKMAPQPIQESQLLAGHLEPTNEAYALAKIAGLKMVQFYASEYGHDWLTIMPTNIYGPEDNFNLSTGHVLPALLNKFHSAKMNNAPEVTIWGTGSPMREFLHSDDLASACLFMLENIHDPNHFNVGTGLDISIRELAETIKATVGFDGEIVFDHTKPDGTPRKLLDVSKLSKSGWRSSIGLQKGLRLTYAWFLEADRRDLRM